MTWRVFAFLSLAFLLVTSREPPWADAHVVYDTTQALVDRFELDVHLESGPVWFYAHNHGRKFGVFPLGNVVAMAPSYVFYKVVRWATHRELPPPPPPGQPGKAPPPPKRLGPPPADLIPEPTLHAFACHVSPSLMLAGACALFFHLLRRRGTTTRWALLGTFILAFATLVLIYARATYSEALQAVAMMWLIERTLSQARAPSVSGLGWLGIASGLLCNAKLVYVLLLPFVVAYLIYEQRDDVARLVGRAWLGLLAFAEMSALALWHNWIKTDSIWNSGYAVKDGIFSGDLIAGVYSFILSPGKSVLLYAPPIILAALGLPVALRRRRAETWFLLSLIVVTTLFNAKFRHWHADYCWGPRHLVAVIPPAMLLAFPWLPEALARGRRWLRQGALGVVIGLGLWVQLLGCAFYWDHYIRIVIAVKDQTGAPGWYLENLSHAHYIPVFSPLRGHAWMLRHFLRGDQDVLADAPWRQVVPQPLHLEDMWARVRLDWWFLNFVEGTDRAAWAGLICLALLGGATGAAGVSLTRRLQRVPRGA